jgi:hypothetical protein
MDHDPARFDDVDPIGVEPPSLAPALAAGGLAAIAGGLLWAALVGTTGYEVGYAAVALGGLVGFVMSRSTCRRDSTVASLAAVLALAGLFAARAAIAEFVMPRASVSEVLADPELMTEAAVLDLELDKGFPEDLQAEYDAIPASAMIPDEIYTRMWDASEDHLAGLSDEEQAHIAGQFIDVVLGDPGMMGRIAAQLTLFDLLWVFLALSAAWKVMRAGPVHPDDGTGASIETV